MELEVTVPKGAMIDDNGLLVELEMVAALTASIRRVAGDADLRRRLGETGRRKAAGSTWPAIADRYIEVCDQEIQAGHSADA